MQRFGYRKMYMYISYQLAHNISCLTLPGEDWIFLVWARKNPSFCRWCNTELLCWCQCEDPGHSLMKDGDFVGVGDWFVDSDCVSPFALLCVSN